MGVRFGDISSVLRELKCGLSIAICASSPSVIAEKLLSADVFEVRYSFCL